MAVCDRDGALAERVARELDAAGGRTLAVEVDVSDSGAVGLAVERIGADLGPVDILVNNAAIDVIQPFVDTVRRPGTGSSR